MNRMIPVSILCQVLQEGVCLIHGAPVFTQTMDVGVPR